MAFEELLKALDLQAQANRALDIQRREVDKKSAYANIEKQLASGSSYVQLGDASVPEGTTLAANYDASTGEVVFVETYDTGQPGSVLAEKVKCANGTDCLDSDFCYGWYECDPCEWCESNQCQPRDPNRPCSATWECPCPPADDQHYDCVDGTCLLTCVSNDDCPETQVCGLTTGYCGPGCTSDQQCDPTNPDSVGDAQANTFCLDYECVFPCDPVRYCKSDTDCFEYEYCGDKEYRVASDPTDGSAKYQCLQGCRPGTCEDGEECNLESRSCERVCIADSDCQEGEGCDEGKCVNIGKLCSTKSDCGEREYCNSDGRCIGGCETNSDCDVICEKDSNCVASCGPDPSCTCEGEGCYNENWRDLCPRNPACIAACPEDPNCARSKGSVCVDNRCEKTCSDSSDCLSDEICKDGICMLKESTPTAGIDERLGCDCGDVCNRFGTCEPAICVQDEECPPCSICENGVCIPGCSDENPCPNNGCCGPDGRCTKSCRIDLDCATEPGNQLCLEGGCCGLICDPLVPCISRSDCEAGQFCGEEGYCLDGCRSTFDCLGLEGLNKCEKAYVKAPNGVLAPCEYYPNEQCFSEIGQCVQFCLTSADCQEDEVCIDESCTTIRPTCSNDLQCTEDGEICIDGTCMQGCRTSSQCKEGESCVETRCESRCGSDEVCKALLGDAGVCVNGSCTTINEGSPKEGGHKGCECYEFCDKQGYCKPYICDSDLDCEEEACGSCLVGNVCGECKSDSDCPGTKVCDEGTCAYACAPAGADVCKGTGDCPDGFYCDGGKCERGCVSNADCRADQVCRNEQCVSKCISDASCASDERCIEGGCVYVGPLCDSKNIQVQILEDRLKFYSRKEELGIELTEDEKAQKQQLQDEKSIAENKDCPADHTCNGSYCEKNPEQCVEDFECTYPEECINGICVEKPSLADYKSFDPQVIGCESCAEVCDEGKCVAARCKRDADCPCGYCNGVGQCIEECRSDFDCGGRRCVDGECIECLSNSDCISEYGPDAVCDGGTCATPCYTGLSTGDCNGGLDYGDTCQNCPDQCPSDAPCRRVEEVCGVQEVYDVIAQRTRVHITYCEVCARRCFSSTDCEPGSVCGGFGYCRQSDGRCTFDSDCAADALANGTEMICRNNTCIEKGVTCFTNSDCDNGEVCDGDTCVVGECGSDDPCQAGKTCIDNKCVWQCGSGSEVFICGDGKPCPPGMRCSARDTLGGYCLRDGVNLSEITEPGCPQGEFCCNGGCVAKTAERKCCSDEHCSGSKKCCDGICKSNCEEKSVSEPSLDENGFDEEPEEKQDNCQKAGKCCGEDGYCVPCGCDDKNPCGAGQCCDKDTGVCYSLSEHPNTKYGAPLSCSYHPHYCEILDPEGETFDPQTLGDDKLFRGCEVVDAVTREVRCWEGKEKADWQIANMLRGVCFEQTTKECKCDDIPEVDECIFDLDCGPCARCVERTFRNDACCALYGEGEITDTENIPIPTGTDFIQRKVCEGDPDKEQSECGCRSSDDCTECEICQGGGPNSLGVCVAQCEELCPCGGELTNGQCKSCQERFGPCATEGNFDIGSDYVDPQTGEIISAPGGCACILDRSKKCCEGFSSIADLKYRRTKCAEQTATLGDGTVYTIQTDVCLDAAKDECAQCIVDSQCPGTQVCKGNICISQCGRGSSDPANTGTGDGQDRGGVGGDPYSCWCCSDEGECRARYESWLESRSNPKGPWTISYLLNGSGPLVFKSSAENYQDAINALRASYPNSSIEIIKADGSSSDGDCRPCQCTKTGIECGAWIKCESCYEWKKVGGDSLLPKAEVLRLEQKIGQVEEAIANVEETIEEQLEKVLEAEGQLNGAKNYLLQQTTISKSQLDYLYQVDDQYRDELNEINLELIGVEKKIADLAPRIAIAAANEKEDDLVLLNAQDQSLKAERQILIDRRLEVEELRQANRNEIAQKVAEAPNDAQIQLEQKQSNFDGLNNGLQLLRERKATLEGMLANYVNDRAYAENPKGVSYEQTRTCDCCKENTCRDESECTYGTCYFCVTEYDDTPGKAYEAALYGTVLKNKIFPGSPDRTEDTVMTGRFSWPFLLAEDTCVKYECTDGLGYEQREGRGYNVRYYEYCTGSLLGCIFSTNKYLQGWLYQIDLREAGTYFTSDGEHWVKMGKYEGMAGVNSEGFVESKCLYSNPAGIIGAATLVTFVDLVAGHPICNKADLLFGCPDDNPGCAPIYDTFYEAGAPDLVILRLEREKEYQQAYYKWLDGYVNYLEEFKYSQLDEKAALEQQVEYLGGILDNLKTELANLKQQKAEYEKKVEQGGDNLDSNREAIDIAQQAFDEAQALLEEKIEATSQAAEELGARQFERGVAQENITSGRAELNKRFLELNQLKADRKEKNDTLDTLDPLSADYVILQNEIANLDEEIGEKQSAYSSIVGEVLGYEEEYKQADRNIEWNTCELPDNYNDTQYRAEGQGECASLYAKKELADNEEADARADWLEKWTTLVDVKKVFDGTVDTREEDFATLRNLITAVENTEALVEQYTELAGGLVWNPKQCPEGRIYKFLSNGGSIDGVLIGKGICCTINSEGEINCAPGVYVNAGGYERECNELCEKIAKIDENLIKIEEVITIVVNERNLADTAIKEKTAEIERLKEKDENTTPPYAIGPVPRPTFAKDAEELREELKANIELDEYLKEQKAWPPGAE